MYKILRKNNFSVNDTISELTFGLKSKIIPSLTGLARYLKNEESKNVQYL